MTSETSRVMLELTCLGTTLEGRTVTGTAYRSWGERW